MLTSPMDGMIYIYRGALIGYLPGSKLIPKPICRLQVTNHESYLTELPNTALFSIYSASFMLGDIGNRESLTFMLSLTI